ncbi:putative Vacuolar protein 8 [Purpureocillium lavendulum]|uniref:Vacuolar protein 8 n=1 Tax=Purpureocillium lavendulum TaxID=1247861 RepID=A0AB34FHW7_9HYPO|nr:putative Vacuolar protein 8 [Purpureocillium lavendulum]
MVRRRTTQAPGDTMRCSSCLLLGAAGYLAGFAAAAVDAVYVTDIAIYSILAPCAQSAVSYNIASETYNSQCGSAASELQSCICSNTRELQSVTQRMTSAVTSSCGSSASDDVWSASKVMDQYCNPAKTITFATPTTNQVNAFITELAEISYLPQCAQSAISYAVMGNNRERCPQDASLFASCVCKGSKVTDIDKSLSESARSSCTNNEDMTAAVGFFSEYCAMNNGTTSFAKPPRPPGDMTYHITGLPQFKSLNKCAQQGVSSAIFASGMRGKVSSTLTSDVKIYCSRTATDDVTSAMAVFDFYCSAADNKVVATGADSVSETQPPAMSRTGVTSPSASKTGSSSGSGGDNGGSDSSKDGNGGGGGGGGNKTAIIAASVLGGVVAIGIVAAIILYVRHKRRKQARGEQIPAPPDENNGKSELDGKSDWTGRIGSPASTNPMPELHTPSHSPRPELHGGGAMVPELGPYQAPRPELQGDLSSNHSIPSPHQQSLYGVSPYSQHAQSPYGGRPGYEVSPASAQGQAGYAHGWQSGPVESYELDSNVGRRNQ